MGCSLKAIADDEEDYDRLLIRWNQKRVADEFHTEHLCD